MINSKRHFIASLIFSSRWLQAPLYFGLILALGIYVYKFAVSLFHLFKNLTTFNDIQIMLQVLDLIDVVMVANLLIMVIVGGYETFVSRLQLNNHPDHPEWLDEVNSGSMKIKVAIALISISSIHLLRIFIDATVQKDNHFVLWQIIIHLTLVASALCLAVIYKFTLDARKKLN